MRSAWSPAKRLWEKSLWHEPGTSVCLCHELLTSPPRSLSSLTSLFMARVLNVPLLMSLEVGSAYPPSTHPCLTSGGVGPWRSPEPVPQKFNLSLKWACSLDMFFCPELNQNLLNPLHLPGKQTGFGHQYLKTVLWLASWIKGQSLSREPETFNAKDDAETTEDCSSWHSQPPAPCLRALVPVAGAQFRRQPWAQAGWVGREGSRFFYLFGGGFRPFKT